MQWSILFYTSLLDFYLNVFKSHWSYFTFWRAQKSYLPAVLQLSLCWALPLSSSAEILRPERLVQLVSDHAAWEQNTLADRRDHCFNPEIIWWYWSFLLECDRWTNRLIGVCFEKWCNLWSSLLIALEFSWWAGPLGSTGPAAAGTPLRNTGESLLHNLSCYLHNRQSNLPRFYN